MAMLMRSRMPYEQRDGLHVLDDRLERVFEEMFGSWPHVGRSWRLPLEGKASWSPPMDIREDDRTLTVKVQVPGVDKKDVKISVDGEVVEIRGERKESYDTAKGGFRLTETRYGAFARCMRLPSYVDPDHATASFKDGELTVTFPKQVGETGRTIAIKDHGARTVGNWFEKLGQKLRSLIRR